MGLVLCCDLDREEMMNQGIDNYGLFRTRNSFSLRLKERNFTNWNSLGTEPTLVRLLILVLAQKWPGSLICLNPHSPQCSDQAQLYIIHSTCILIDWNMEEFCSLRSTKLEERKDRTFLEECFRRLNTQWLLIAKLARLWWKMKISWSINIEYELVES